MKPARAEKVLLEVDSKNKDDFLLPNPVLKTWRRVDDRGDVDSDPISSFLGSPL